jgi:16S rRNA (cytosine967-C5)-methyltransferase
MRDAGNTPRGAAQRLLQKIFAARGYANLALDAELVRLALSKEDAALCAALVYGVMERRRTLDFQLEQLLAQPLEKLPLPALTALRLGLYQLFYMDKVPDHAAIFESVELAKQMGARPMAGLVNAVLRRARGRGLQLPPGESDHACSIRYSCPQWLCKLWRNAYGAQTMRELLEHSFGNSTLTLRANTLKTTAAQLQAQLGGQRLAELPDALQLEKPGAVQRLQGFAEGLFHVQDAAAQLCCEALDPKPGDVLFDLCAAPGGKSFTCAERMRNQGRVVAADRHPQRLKLLDEGARRLGLSCIKPVVGDATDMQWLSKLGKSGKVLCDVPCSGLGILRKKPDIREKMAQELDKLPEMQYAILCGGATCLQPGGTLVYATCTLNPAENETVCQRFLREHPNFQLRRQRTFMPHIDHTDGFYFAVFSQGGL